MKLALSTVTIVRYWARRSSALVGGVDLAHALRDLARGERVVDHRVDLGRQRGRVDGDAEAARGASVMRRMPILTLASRPAR